MTENSAHPWMLCRKTTAPTSGRNQLKCTHPWVVCQTTTPKTGVISTKRRSREERGQRREVYPSPLSGGTENPEQGQGRGGDLSESVFEPSAVTALAVTDPFAPVSVFSADTVIPADTPEWCILGVFAALEVEANDGAVRPVTPRDRQHVRQFNTKFGIEMAVRILVYGIRNWKDFSTRNRITMPRTLGVIWKHSDALLAEALHGGPTGYIRTLQKDEVAAEQDRARQRMYAERGGPFLGFEALMGHRAPHPNAAAATRAIDALLSNLTELRPAQPALLAPVVERR